MLDVDKWMEFATKHGMPWAFLIAMCAGLFYFAYRSGRFLAPRIDKLIDKHGNLVDSVATNNDKQTELLDRFAQSLVDGHGVTHAKLDAANTKLDDVHQIVKQTWHGRPIQP